MILLNVLRVLITVIGMFAIETMRRAYALEGFGLLGVFALVMLLVFIAGDFVEMAVIAHFNKEEDEKP